MDAGHWIRKKGGGWLIGVPPEVRRALAVTHRKRLYWVLTRRGEAVLAESRTRSVGRQPVRKLARELAAALAEVAAIQQRDALRDRGMYAEGFAHGYLQARARLDMPGGPSAERGHRRSMWRWAFPEAAMLEDPKQSGPRQAPSAPRMNAHTRRARRARRAPAPTSPRGVEVVDAPVLVTPDGEPTEGISDIG